MPSLAVMKARIASDLARDDLTAQIASAIQDAIEEHERERFWFNEGYLTFATVDGQREYTSVDAAWIASVIEIDALFAMVNGNKRELTPADPGYLELMNDSSTQEGQPNRWGYFDQSIVLYPTPDQAYTITALAHYRLDPLADDSDSNAWTTQAEQLIRRHARLLLANDVMKDEADAARHGAGIQTHLNALRAETSRRKARGALVPTEW